MILDVDFCVFRSKVDDGLLCTVSRFQNWQSDSMHPSLFPVSAECKLGGKRKKLLLLKPVLLLGTTDKALPVFRNKKKKKTLDFPLSPPEADVSLSSLPLSKAVRDFAKLLVPRLFT